jgi:prepilin-type processing-associated H-X9-DG protein
MKKILLSMMALSLFVCQVRSQDQESGVVGGINLQALLETKPGKQLYAKVKDSLEKPFKKMESEVGFRPDSILSITFHGDLFETTHPRAGFVFELKSGSSTKFKEIHKDHVVHTRGVIKDFPDAVGYITKQHSNCVLNGDSVAFLELSRDNSEKAFSEFGSKLLDSHPKAISKINTKKSIASLHVGSNCLNSLQRQPLPPEVAPFKPLMEAKEYSVNVYMNDNKLIIDAQGEFESNKEAEEAKECLEQLIVLSGIGLNAIKQELSKEGDQAEIKKIIDLGHAWRKSAKPKVEDKFLKLRTEQEITDDKINAAAAMISKIFEVSVKVQSQNNLKQIALAVHNYESSYDKLPGNICTKGGDEPKPLLSWRVAILPYMDEEELYKKFNLNEPWDSPNNKKLIPLIPKVYANPAFEDDTKGSVTIKTTNVKIPAGKPALSAEGRTPYLAPAFKKRGGLHTMLPTFPGESRTFANISDGMSNTIMVLECPDSEIWTKPADLIIDPDGKLPKMGGVIPKGFNVAFGDGSVRFLKETIKEATLRAMITANGGEVVQIDD